MQGAIGPNGQLFQAFPLGGPCRTETVGAEFVDLIGSSSIDLVMVRIPAGSKRVRIVASSDPLAGEAATSEAAAVSYILDAGHWTFSTNRDLQGGARFYLFVDPTDVSDAAETADVLIFEAAR